MQGPLPFFCNWEFGIWYLVFGIWNLEFGIWNLEFGIWNLEFDIWNLGIWNLVFGIWDLEFGLFFFWNLELVICNLDWVFTIISPLISILIPNSDFQYCRFITLYSMASSSSASAPSAIHLCRSARCSRSSIIYAVS